MSATCLSTPYNAAEVPDIKFLYLNLVASIPPRFVLLESMYLALAIFIFVFHVWKFNRIGLFFGWILFGFNMEFVGVMLVRSHLHFQFVVQLASFCSLKEALWYPITTYVSYSIASSIPGLSHVSQALLVGFFQGIKALQLETIVYRKGIAFMAVNPDFPIADVTCTTCTLYGAPLLMIFSNTVLAIGTGYVAAKCEASGIANSILGMLCVGFCIPFAYAPFVFMNILKFAGCAELAPGLFLQLKEAIISFNVFGIFDVYAYCMKNSTTTEGMVLAFTWTCLLLMILHGIFNVIDTKEKSKGDESDLVMIPLFQLGYNLCLLVPLILHDQSGVPLSASLTLFTLLLIAQIGFSIVLLSFAHRKR